MSIKKFTRFRILLWGVLLIGLVACQSGNTNSTPDTVGGSTSSNAEPSLTPAQAIEPAAEWHGFPIMPGAISGGEISTDQIPVGYEFTTQATIEEITQFYEAALAELGYSLSGSMEETGATYLFFENSSAQSIIIRILPEGDINRVQIAA